MKSKILDKISGTHTTRDLDEKEHLAGKERLDMIAVSFHLTVIYGLLVNEP